MAARLANEAREARASGQIVRAYLLYGEAAARDPHEATYRANRDAIASAAKLLTQAEIQNADISRDVKTAEREAGTAQPPIEIAKLRDWQQDEDLQPLPDLQPNPALATFETRGDEKTLFQQVASTYGIRPVFDPQLDVQSGIRFSINQVDFRTAMEALTTVTHTFVFPISQREIFVARDTDVKRDEYEPNALLTFSLPNALGQQDLVEAANAVRAILGSRVVGWDTGGRIVMIRDRYSRARIARSLLESLLLPRAQVSLEVQFLTFDSERSFHYGASLQNAFQLIDFGHIGGLRNIIASPSTPASFLAFGGGATLFGVGLTNANLFATYSESFSRNLYDATVVVMDGQTANFHIGDRYPIPQTLYTGYQQTSGASIYNPVGQVTLEDLGIILKMAPRVHSDGEISIDLEGDLKSLGSQSIDSVPEISERQFKGMVRLREGEWAVITGLDSTTQSRTRNGLPVLSQIPFFAQLLSENTRDKLVSNTLLVIKPTITRLPMSALISPQFLIGPLRGDSVIM